MRPGGGERGVRSCERKLCLRDVRTAAEEGRGQAPRKRWGLQARQLSAGPNGRGRTDGQNAQGIFLPRYGKIALRPYLCRCLLFRFGLPRSAERCLGREGFMTCRTVGVPIS